MNRRNFIGALAAGITTLAVTTRLGFVVEIERPRTIYVSPNGKGRGTQSDPTNIRRALEMAEAGTYVVFAASVPARSASSSGDAGE